MFFYYIDVETSLGYNYPDYGGSQLCTSNGGETARRKTVYTDYCRVSTLEFSYDDPMALKEIDRIIKSWKQTFRINAGLVGNKVTMEYAVWKARRPRDLVIPPMMERESINEVPQEGSSDLEIAKQVFDEEMKRMRVKSRNNKRR